MGNREASKLMTVEELADYLNLSAGTIYGWVARKEVPFVRAGRALRFRRDEVDQWIEQGRQPKAAAS